MDDASPTRQSLLIRIRDPADGQAWATFVDVYAPLVYGYARRRGLQDADAADLTQDVLRSVARAAPSFRYDPRRGTFRSWLFTVARNALCDFLAKHQRLPQASGDTAVQARLEQEPDHHEDSDLWDQEYQRRLFQWAAGRVKSEFQDGTWQAFWDVSVHGIPAKEVARRQELTVGAVYIAKSRVLARIKREIERNLDIS